MGSKPRPPDHRSERENIPGVLIAGVAEIEEEEDLVLEIFDEEDDLDGGDLESWELRDRLELDL